MNQQNKARTNLHGLLLVDKSSGMTSHDVVSRVRKIAKTKEVGHTGTLDPLASGLMVVLIGEATKLSSIVTDGDKSYLVELCLGIETDTLDITGQIVKQIPVDLDSQFVIDTALALSGELELPVPLYSAKKIDGRKLYEYAREGVEIQIPTKEMSFWNVENKSELSQIKENKYSFHLHCSKGSFIRSWVQLLGERLGCGATMTALRRTSSHHFNLNHAMTLENLSAEAHKVDFTVERMLLPIVDAINGVRVIKVSGHDEVLLKNGQISHDLRSKLIVVFNPDRDQWVFAVSKEKPGQVLAIIGVEPGHGFKIKRGFKY